jgi:hypothetical protein
MDDLGAFARQVPIGFFLAPIFFGVLYIILMAIIFQRGAVRRRKRRAEKEAMMQGMATPQAAYTTTAPPDKPKVRPKTPAIESIPEPDLDLLVMPPTFAEIVEPPRSMATPAQTDADWMQALALTPDQPMQFVEIDPTMSNSGNDTGDAVEVMRVWRDLSDGTLIIQMGDKRYRSVSDISGSPDLLRRFTAVVRELWNMVNNPHAARQMPSPADAGALPSPEGAVGMKARIGLLKEQPPPEEPQRPNVLRQLGRTVSGQPATPKLEQTGSGGIADAVEEFLQFKLTGHPEFSRRSIHIRPSIDGGVRIEVDGNSYQGIGDVVDADVRDFLFGVMREWEARQ